jgi:uncharacterized protein (TIGR02231 family)
MIRRLLSALLVAAALSLSAGAASEIVAASRVAAVTVYPGAALVTRAATVDLPAGSSQVLFEGLPSSIDAALATASGEGNFVIEGVDVRRRPASEASSPRVRELEAKIETLEGDVATAEGEIQSLESSQVFLARLGDLNREALNQALSRGELKPADLDASVSAYHAQSLTIQKELQAARGRKRTVMRSIEALRRELREVQAASGREVVSAVVSVSATAPVRGVLRLRYAVRGATWEPVYDGRAWLEKSEVNVTYSALVRQSTGEDWQDVEVTLSTAQPAIGASIPDLDPIYVRPRPAISYRTVSPAGGYGVTPVTSMMPEMAREADDIRGMGGEYSPAQTASNVATAEIASSVNATFRLANRSTIQSDNQPRKVRILDANFPCQFFYRAIPEFGERAYIVAKFKNASDALFLAGDVAVYQGQDYVGKGYVGLVSPGDTFELQLGVDPSVEITRTLIENVEDPSAGFSRRSRVSRRFRITVENHRSIPVRLNVYDRVPVSNHDDVKVERVRGTEDPSEVRDNGILRWDILLQPGQKRIIEHGFRVEYPQGMALEGL